jgi:four helix bundle protein
MIPKFTKEEIYGLTSQLGRVSISISSNIAEGCGRKTKKDFCKFLHNTLGSTKEIENQIIIAMNLKYITENEYSSIDSEINFIEIMIRKLIEAIENPKRT